MVIFSIHFIFSICRFSYDLFSLSFALSFVMICPFNMYTNIHNLMNKIILIIPYYCSLSLLEDLFFVLLLYIHNINIVHIFLLISHILLYLFVIHMVTLLDIVYILHYLIFYTIHLFFNILIICYFIHFSLFYCFSTFYGFSESLESDLFFFFTKMSSSSES